MNLRHCTHIVSKLSARMVEFEAQDSLSPDENRAKTAIAVQIMARKLQDNEAALTNTFDKFNRTLRKLRRPEKSNQRTC